MDYRGFRALAFATLPIHPEDGMSLGFDDDGKFHQLDYAMRTELQDIGTMLNLSEYKTLLKQKVDEKKLKSSDSRDELLQFESIPISNFIRVYGQTDGMIENLHKLSRRQTEKQAKTLAKSHYLESIQYVLRLSNLFPLDLDYQHQTRLASNDLSNEELHYMITHPDRVLRQEIFCSSPDIIKTDVKK